MAAADILPRATRELERPRFLRKRINISTVGRHDLIPGQSGERITIWQMFLWNVAEQDLEFYAGPEESLSGPFDSFPEKSGFLLPYTGAPHWDLEHGHPLQVTTTGATQLSGWILYRIHPN